MECVKAVGKVIVRFMLKALCTVGLTGGAVKHCFSSITGGKKIIMKEWDKYMVETHFLYLFLH